MPWQCVCVCVCVCVGKSPDEMISAGEIGGGGAV